MHITLKVFVLLDVSPCNQGSIGRLQLGLTRNQFGLPQHCSISALTYADI